MLIEDGAVVLVSKRTLLRRALSAASVPEAGPVVDLDGGGDLHDVLGRSTPSVVVLDTVHPWRSECCPDPLVCVAAIRAGSPGTRVLLLGDAPPPERMTAHVLAGVSGVFDPDAPLGRFGAAVDAVARGEAWYTRRALGEAIDRLSRGRVSALRGQESDGRPGLTAREVEILTFLARGFGHQRISEELGVSPHTARTHVRNILRKLDVHSRADAVRFAVSAGYIDQPRM